MRIIAVEHPIVDVPIWGQGERDAAWAQNTESFTYHGLRVIEVLDYRFRIDDIEIPIAVWNSITFKVRNPEFGLWTVVGSGWRQVNPVPH